jgi:ketosteroid isomerase-like protein
VSRERVETVRRIYEHLAATRELPAAPFAPDFVWDMSTFRGWPERPAYDGFEGAVEFLGDWVGMWDDWEATIEEIHDLGDRVLLVAYQRGCAKTTGVPLDMRYAQVWTFRGEQLIRTQSYADSAEALEAAGLSPPPR